MQNRVSKNKKWANTPIATVLKLYIISIVIFFIFRGILFVTELDRIDLTVDKYFDIIEAFFLGVRFDIVVSGYILLLPMLFIFVLDIFKYKSKITSSIIFAFIFTLFSLSFLIAAVDIPFFNQFFARLSVDVFEWMGSPIFVLKMVFQETKYFLFLIPPIVFIFLYYKLLKRVFRNNVFSNINTYLKIPLYLFVLLLMLVGVRGRTAIQSPIRIGTAYFCNNAFLNQLGLNPLFTFMDSYLVSLKSANKPINLINSGSAKANVQKYLKIEKQNYASPIARFIQPDSIASNKPNVVVVIMESMSVAKMKRGGNTNNLTPFLDSLSYQSLYFENLYTAGKHTFNGIFSTIFSFPALYSKHTMKQLRKYNGISNALKKYDYQTIYFTTHDVQYDNAEAFLLNNDFDSVIGEKDFPSDEIKTKMGVRDDYLFHFSMPILSKLAENDKPFLSVFMTISDHIPYYIPEYFHPTADNIEKQAVQYADWSLKQFIKEASQQKWFKNTIFVFVADHGKPIQADYAISLDYHHSPFLIYAPGILDTKKTLSCIAGQIDVYPTIMGLLKLPYINNTLGIDLLNESRPYIIINDDNKIGVLDNEYFLIMKEGENLKLYKYKTHDKHNYSEEYPDKATDMEKYAKSNLQVYQDMMTKNLTYIKN